MLSKHKRAYQLYVLRNTSSNISLLSSNNIRKAGTNINAKANLEFINVGDDAKWQYQFTYKPGQSGGGTRKYVDEVLAYTDGSYSILSLRIKMEYLGRDGWKPAGEYRNKACNISYQYQLNAPSGHFSSSYGINQNSLSSSSYSNQDLFITLASTFNNSLPNQYGLQMSGTITQDVENNPAYNWIEQGDANGYLW